MKKKSDIKFIIYQSLYVFVICIIAIKGADINLDEVELKKLLQANHDYIDTSANKIISKEDLSKMIFFDSAKYLIVSKEDYKNNPGQYAGMPVTQSGLINPFTPNNPENENTTNNPDVRKIEPGSEIIQVTFPSNFIQFRVNSISNPNTTDMIVQTSIGSVTIPPKSSKNVTLMGDNAITLSAGGQTKSYPVKENKKPQIKFEKMTTMGEDTRVSVLHKTNCFRVTIADDYPDQIDVKFSGPVTFKEAGSGVYDIIMNAFGSKQAFDNFTDTKSGKPYSIGFTVTAKDKISGHTATGQQSFLFGEW